ncbi:MAG TPA: cytochrome P450 [Actinomycetota bacterium]
METARGDPSARAAVTAELSALGAIREFRRDALGLLERLAALGDVVRVPIPWTNAFLLNHPELVHEVLVTHYRDFRKGPTVEASRMLLGESLLTTEGDRHRRQRRMIQPVFHRERIAGYADTMVRLGEDAADRWKDGATLDVHAAMASLTLAVVTETLFGAHRDDHRAATVTRALTELLAMFDRAYSPAFRLLVHLPTPTMRRFRRIQADLDGIVGDLVAERRAAGADGDDVLSVLLRARDEDEGMTDAEVRDEALTLFLAGHETTANALTWTWWWLSEHPEIEARLHQELDAGLDGRTPTVDDLERLRYAEWVLSESIRLRPPAWAIGRRAIADVEIGGVPIRAGSVVVVSPWLLHRDPRWWTEPTAFRPERWSPEESAGRRRDIFLPFGAGPRRCVGEPFAWMEAVLLLSTIARRWRFRPTSGRPVELQAVVTLRPRHGLPMIAQRRRLPAG